MGHPSNTNRTQHRTTDDNDDINRDKSVDVILEDKLYVSRLTS